MKISSIVSIVSYGKYSKIFLNYLSSTTENEDLRNYIDLLKSKWIIKNEELLERSENILKKIKNKGLQYLTKAIILDLTDRLEHYESNKSLYNRLTREFKNVPSSCRNILGKALKANYANTYKMYSKDFRMWSDIHEVDEADTAVLLNIEARKLLGKGKRKEAIKRFYKVYDHALKFPHPSFVLIGANNVVWFSYKEKLPVVPEDINRLSYCCGYFFDEAGAFLNELDTLLTVLKHYKDIAYFEIAELMMFHYNKMLKKEPEYKNKFEHTIKGTKSISPSSLKACKRKDEIRNTQKLQNFLKKKIGKINQFAMENDISKTILYDILNGKTACIKIASLKKIVTGLGFAELSFDYPRTINCIIQMIKEDKAFEANREKISSFSVFKLKCMFLKGFMTLVSLEDLELSELFKYVARDREKLYTFIKDDSTLIAFFNRCVQYEFSPETVNPYYKARLDLVNALFNQIKESTCIKSLIALYVAIETVEDYEMLNTYFMQYVRYSTTSWCFDVEKVLDERKSDPDYEKISLFCKKLNISEIFGYLCTWEFEGAAHSHLFDLLSKKIV